LGAIEVSLDGTLQGITGAQHLANQIGPKSFEIIKLGEKTLIKGFTIDALGRQVAIVGLVVTGADMIHNGVTWQNGTDLTVGLASFAVPGIGWAIGAVYFIGDAALKHYTGKGIGEHIGDGVEATKKVSKSLGDQFINGLSNLESWLRSWRPR